MTLPAHGRKGVGPPFFTPCLRPAPLLWTLSRFPKLPSHEPPLMCRKFQISPKTPFFDMEIVGGGHTLLCPSSGVLLGPYCGPFSETRTRPTLHRGELSGTFRKNTPVRSGNDRWSLCGPVWIARGMYGLFAVRLGRTVERPLSCCSRVLRRFMSSGQRSTVSLQDNCGRTAVESFADSYAAEGGGVSTNPGWHLLSRPSNK